jgi:hypothetical protein
MSDELRDKNVVIENKNRQNEAERPAAADRQPPCAAARKASPTALPRSRPPPTSSASLVMSSEMPPANVMNLLNGLFTRFDEAAHNLGIEKIRQWGMPTWRCTAYR